MLVKLPKKRDGARECARTGEECLSSQCQVKLFTLIEALREKQPGFQKDKSYTDHIATLRITMEQSVEW